MWRTNYCKVSSKLDDTLIQIWTNLVLVSIQSLVILFKAMQMSKLKDWMQIKDRIEGAIPTSPQG